MISVGGVAVFGGTPPTPSDGSLYPPEVRPHVGMILWDQGGSIPRIKISKSPIGDLYTTIFDPIYDFFLKFLVNFYIPL